MTVLRLRAQLLFIVAFLQLFALGVGLAYRVQIRAVDRLERSLEEDLAVLARLPRLRENLRRLDQLAKDYLATGAARRLEERGQVLLEERRLLEELSQRLSPQKRERLLKELESGLADYLSQQNPWIERKSAGALSRANAAHLAARQAPFDGVIARMAAMTDENVADILARQKAVRGATRSTFLVILLTGIAASLLLGHFLSRFLIGPIARLQQAAGQWRLGKAWEMPPEPGSPELLALQNSVSEMSRRLNDQYEALAKLERLKTRLVAMVSHEFNNSLGILMSVLALLKGQEEGAPAVKGKRDEYYEIMNSQVRSMALASANLLNMAQVEEGKFKVLKRRVELEGLLLEVVERMEVLARLKEIGLRAEFAAGPMCVLADPDALNLILNNLLSNAIKYTPPRGRVEVGFAGDPADPGKVRLWVRDTGIGIAAQDKELIFSGFFRTEEGKKAAKGFGIGLTLVKALVEAHGCELALESEPGRGSSFSFILPILT